MLLVQKPFHPHSSSFDPMSSHKSHFNRIQQQSHSQQQHRRTPSAPATVIDVLPTKTPGLLTLSKPLNLHQQRQPKSKQPSMSPPVSLSTSPEKLRGRGNHSSQRDNAKSSSSRPDFRNASRARLGHKHSQSQGFGARNGGHSRQPSPPRLPFPSDSNSGDDQKQEILSEAGDAPSAITDITAKSKLNHPTALAAASPSRPAKRRNRHSIPVDVSSDPSPAKQTKRATSANRSRPVPVPKHTATSPSQQSQVPLSRSYPVMSTLAAMAPPSYARPAFKRSATDREWDTFPICDDNETVHGSATVSPALSHAVLPTANSIESTLASVDICLSEPRTPVRETRTWQQEVLLGPHLATQDKNTCSDLDMTFSSSDNDFEEDELNGPRTAPLSSSFQYFPSPSPSPFTTSKNKERKNKGSGRKEHTRAGSMPIPNFSFSPNDSVTSRRYPGASSDNERGPSKHKRGVLQLTMPQPKGDEMKDGMKPSHNNSTSFTSSMSSLPLPTGSHIDSSISGSMIPNGTIAPYPPRPRILSYTGHTSGSMSTSNIPMLGNNGNTPVSIGRARARAMRSAQFNVNGAGLNTSIGSATKANAAGEQVYQLYASSTFQNSPSPESLPPPSFSFAKARGPRLDSINPEGEDADDTCDDTLEGEEGDSTLCLA